MPCGTGRSYDAIEHALLLVLSEKIGVVAPPGAASLREDEDTLFARHESIDIGVALESAPPLLDDLFHAIFCHTDKPATPPRDFGDSIVPEPAKELIQDAVRDRDGADFKHEPIPCLHSFRVFHRASFRICDGARPEAAFLVLVLLVLRGEKAGLDELQELVARRDVYSFLQKER